MKFLVLAAIAAVAAAVPQASSSTNGPATTTYSMTPQETCLNACDAGDVGCRAKCIIVPNPNSMAVNQTNTCFAACDQGDGSAQAAAAYAKCTQACISSYYLTVTQIGGNPTSAAATGVSLTVSGGTTTTLAGGAVSVVGGVTSTVAASRSATGSSSAASGSATKGAAVGMQVGSGFAGVAGILAAVFAL